MHDLVDLLVENGAPARIGIVGGAAIALMNEHRVATQDVDAVFAPIDDIVIAAEVVAKKFHLPAGWFNNAVLAFLPFVNSDSWTLWFKRESVEIYLATPDLLLAMKLRANRGRRDTSDIHFLLETLDIQSAEQAQTLYERFYHQEVLSEEAIIRIEDWLRDP